MRDFWILNLGTLGPIGRTIHGPGTLGSLAGVLVYPALVAVLPPSHFAVLFTLAVCLAIKICSRCEVILRQKDPPCLIIDEFLAMIFCLWLTEIAASFFRFEPWPRLLWFSIGLVLFRFFDILKPLGINQLQRLPGGLGVMMDDLLAAVYSAGILVAVQSLL